MTIQVILLNDLTARSASKQSRYIGPYVLASRLESAGYRTLVLDWFTDVPDFFEYLEQFLSPDLLAVGVSSTFLSQPLDETHDWTKGRLPRHRTSNTFKGGYLWTSERDELENWSGELRARIQRHNPNAKIVLGGAKTTVIWKNHISENVSIPYRHFDYMVSGHAEGTFLDFVQRLEKGLPPAYVEKNGVRFLEPREPKECPSTLFLPNQAIMPGEALPIEVSRGCMFNCKFCYYDKRFSIVKPISVLREELIRNYETYGTTVYYFCDDCFNDNVKKVESVCNMLLTLPFSIEWVSYARVDMSARFPHAMELMMASGCRGICWGIETLNHKAGVGAGKGMHPDKVKEQLLEWQRKYGENCLFQGSFIVGLPHETHESQKATFDFLVESKPLDFVSVGALTVLDYEATLDGELFEFDYSEYSRNPEKFGFRKITARPPYWEHDTMNSSDAHVLATECAERWYDARGMTFVASIWIYPVLRSLGYSKAEIFDMSRNPENFSLWHESVSARRREWDEKYWRKLAELNAVARPFASGLRPAELLA